MDGDWGRGRLLLSTMLAWIHFLQNGYQARSFPGSDTKASGRNSSAFGAVSTMNGALVRLTPRSFRVTRIGLDEAALRNTIPTQLE